MAFFPDNGWVYSSPAADKAVCLNFKGKLRRAPEFLGSFYFTANQIRQKSLIRNSIYNHNPNIR
jgi:hypothetical protein